MHLGLVAVAGISGCTLAQQCVFLRAACQSLLDRCSVKLVVSDGVVGATSAPHVSTDRGSERKRCERHPRERWHIAPTLVRNPPPLPSDLPRRFVVQGEEKPNVRHVGVLASFEQGGLRKPTAVPDCMCPPWWPSAWRWLAHGSDKCVRQIVPGQGRAHATLSLLMRRLSPLGHPARPPRRWPSGGRLQRLRKLQPATHCNWRQCRTLPMLYIAGRTPPSSQTMLLRWLVALRRLAGGTIGTVCTTLC